MTDIVLLEGNNEVIICRSDCVAQVVEEYFLDTGRNLDDFEVSLIKENEALLIHTHIITHKNPASENINVMEMLPLTLRTKFMGG